MQALKHRRFLAWLPLLFVLVSASVLGAIRDNHISSEVTWSHDFGAGVREAMASHRPLLLNFRSAECGWCGKMDAETFSDPRIVELSHRFVCVAVDADGDGNAETLRRYGVTELPVTIIADERGVTLLPFYGFTTADSLAPALDKTLQLISKNGNP